MTDLEIEVVINKLKLTELSGCYISHRTGITEQSISSYKNNKSRPTEAIARLLEYFFIEEKSMKECNEVKTIDLKNPNRGVESDRAATMCNDLINYLREKDTKIEQLIRENVELQIKIKSSQAYKENNIVSIAADK